jgi:hypothetical protein
LIGSSFISKVAADKRQIAQYFPGVQSSAIRVVYNKRLKGLCDTFTDDEVLSFGIWI